MNEGLIALLSISFGIIGANSTSFFRKESSLALKGNTLVGVFASVFFIKSFGRMGFDPRSITNSSDYSTLLLCINLTVAFLGGFIGVVIAKNLIQKAAKA